jgi:O-antigen/teichoic acid export membrane protein
MKMSKTQGADRENSLDHSEGVSGIRDPDSPRLSHSFLWMFAGWGTYAVCQWALLIVLAKFCSPDMVGIFGLAFAVNAPIMIFFGLQLRLVQATDAGGEYSFREYLGVRTLTTIIGFVVVLLISVLFNYTSRAFVVIALVGVAKGVESISDILYGLLQKYERMNQVSISLIAKGISSVVAMGGLVVATRDVVWGVFGLAIAWTLVLVAYDVPRVVQILRAESGGEEFHGGTQPKIWPGRLFRLVWLALPLGVEAALFSLAVNIPRYSIHRYLGEADLGYYSAISYLMVISGRVTLALNEAASPRLGRRYHDGDKKAYMRLVATLLLIAFLLGGAGVALALLFGKQILTFLYRADYGEHKDAFVWLMVAAALGCIGDVVRYSMTAARLLRTQLALMLLQVVTVWIGCALLVPLKGLVGAAYALCIAAAMRVGTGVVVSWCNTDRWIGMEELGKPYVDAQDNT